MADYQRVVEFLRDVRSMQNPPITDDLKQHAQEFADLCTQVNERLRKCSSLLQQGLRSEAIHLAEEAPNLLDLVTALDLPDPQVWVEFCQATELAVPPPLQLDRAAQLNEAYAIDQPMEHLLGQHRLLALQRAAVGKRLTVMRQLASQDPGSSFWEKDIRQFERVRLRELPTEFYEAVRRRDDTTVIALVHEIEDQPWYETVPEDLRTAINEANARIQRTALETDLRRQLDALHEAYSARHLEQAVNLMAKWNQTIKSAGAPNIAKSIVDQVSPIAAWIEEEAQAASRLKAYNNAVATFTQLLDQDASDAELDGALDRIKAFDDQPVPQNLLDRLHATRARRTQAAKGKQKMRFVMLGTSAAVVLLVAGVVLFLLMRNRSAVSWANRINNTVSTGQIDPIKKILAEQESQAPQFTSDPQVAAARQTALNYVHGFEDRAAKVSAAKVTLADLKSNYAKFLEDSKLSAADLLAKASTLDQQLAALPGDEVNDADSDGSMRALKVEVAGIRTEMQAKASGIVRAQLADLQKKLETLPAGALSPEQQGTLAGVQSEAGALRDIAFLDAAVKTAADDLAKAAADKAAHIESVVSQAADLAALLPKTSTPDGYKAALDAFIAAYPDARQTPDFKLASVQLESVKPLLAWRALVAELGGTSALAPKTAATAAKLAAAVQAFLDGNKDSPLKDQIQAYLDYLKSANDALADTGTLSKSLSDVLANPLTTQLQYLTDTTGRKYFFVAPPKITKGSVGTRTTTQFDALDPSNAARPKAVSLEDPVRLTSEIPVMAPHVALVADIQAKLLGINKTNWDTVGFDLVDMIASSSEDVDPVVKATLLNAVITSLKSTNAAAIGDSYDETIQALTRFLAAPQNATPYLTKSFPPAVVAQLKTIIQAMPPAKTLGANYLAARKQLFADLAFESDVTGMIVKVDGAPTVRPLNDPAEGMVARSPGNKGMTIAGKFTGGKWVLTPEANDLPEGSWLSISK